MKICLDPGHGGKDSGAVGQLGTKESEIALKTCFHIRRGLLEVGHDVTMTRVDDAFVSLDDRCILSNDAGSKAFVSVHCNASINPSAHDFEIWTSPGQTKADPIAENVYMSIDYSFPEFRGRSDKSDGDHDKESKFRVLMGTVAPAILIEIGFISNSMEERWMLDPGWRMRMAGAIVSPLGKLT